MNIYAFKNSVGEQPRLQDFIFKMEKRNVDIKKDDDDKEGKKRRFAGIGYTGDMITGHPYWGNVIFDLSKMRLKDKMAILRDHDNGKIVGFSDGHKTSDEEGLELTGHLTQSTPFGQEVIMLSDEGFPWQMSVRIHPDVIEEVRAGAKASVNGREFSGPFYIFRASKIVETSFTATGWDDGTSATALSHQPQEEDLMSKELEDKVKELDGKLADLSAANTKLTAEKEELNKQLVAFQNAAKEAVKTAIKDAFAKAGQELTDANLDVLCSLPEEARNVMLASIKPKEEPKKEPEGTQLPDGLFSHQADKGRKEPDISDLEGKGLLACCDGAATEFKALQGK